MGEDEVTTDTRNARTRVIDAALDVLWRIPGVPRIHALRTGSVCSLIPGRKGRNCLGAYCLEHAWKWGDPVA